MFNLAKISKYLLIAAVIGIGISYGKVYLFHIVLIPFLFLLLINYKTIIREVKSNIKTITFYHFFAILFIWYGFSILWSSNKLASIYYLAYISMGIAIILAFKYYVQNIDNQLKILKIFGVIFIIEIIFSILESYTSFRYIISPYNDYVSLFGRKISYNPNLSSDILEIIKSTPTGFRWNPNDLAVTMLIITPFLILYKNKIIAIVGTIGSILTIALSGSRVAFFSVFILVLAYIILYVKPKYLLKLVLPMLIIFISGVYSFKALNLDVPKQFINVSATFEAAKVFVSENHELVNDTSSISIRQNLIRNGVTSIKATKGLGVGGGNSNFIHQQKGMKNTHKITSMHNFWIEILVEGGVLMILIFAVWYFFLFRKLYLISKTSSNKDIVYFAKAGSLSLVGFFIGVISLSSAIYFFPMWLLFGFNLATIYNYKNSIKLKY